ncbi:putative flavoprotein CzcO [Geosmithia morbida]|uniref:Flavoprotein CzcO n=1 Tax=Geosmithia morbida TaxID=1094350 RepID=A0A9P5CXG1_9HYPO|nr:putative flavoprotein CzcO [Geosmithia morbida]KAF4119238.1 putative flavoprotein CzcO [Geosmithia morbida]
MHSRARVLESTANTTKPGTGSNVDPAAGDGINFNITDQPELQPIGVREDVTAGAAPKPTANGFTPSLAKYPNHEGLGVDEKGASIPLPRLELVNRFIDDVRPLRVVVIGGGLTGVLAGVLLPVKVPKIELTIFEKNHDFSTFEPNVNWSDQFSPGQEIKEYWQGVAKKYDVYKYAKFGRRVDGLTWSADKSTWTVSTRAAADGGSPSLHEADFVITATGRFNAFQLPDYPGIKDYKGVLRHTSNWDPEFDPTGKKVAVIGNGASGIQVVPNLQPIVERLDHYARGRTWIATSWAGDIRTFGRQLIPEETKKSFEDPDVYLRYRKELESRYWRRFESFIRGSESNVEMREKFIDAMRTRLAKKPELLEHMVPDFSPNCRRLTPGPGYLEAITEDNVDFITTGIKRFTETGIETVDGKHREVDAIFCATGANRDMAPQFPIVGRDGQTLSDTWDPDGQYGFPYSYMGIATPGFPNLLFLQGPHGSGPSGTVPHSAETQITQLAKILRKVSAEGIKSLEPTVKATRDFVQYSDAFFARTVLSDNCRSWYNGGRSGARIHGLWPGSAAHITTVRRSPRWEDWSYEYLDESGNSLLWYLGNGRSHYDADPESDVTTYLTRPDEVNLQDLHERWWRLP